MDSVSGCYIVESGSSTSVGHSQVMDRPVLVAHAGMSTETRSTELRLPDRGSVELCLSAIPSLRALLQISLHNDTNLCYLNSTALAATWTLLQVQLHGFGSLRIAPALSLLCNTQRSASTSLRLIRQLPWTLLLQGWQRLHHQHDAPELVNHLLLLSPKLAKVPKP